MVVTTVIPLYIMTVLRTTETYRFKVVNLLCVFYYNKKSRIYTGGGFPNEWVEGDGLADPLSLLIPTPVT